MRNDPEMQSKVKEWKAKNPTPHPATPQSVVDYFVRKADFLDLPWLGMVSAIPTGEVLATAVQATDDEAVAQLRSDAEAYRDGVAGFFVFDPFSMRGVVSPVADEWHEPLKLMMQRVGDQIREGGRMR